MLLINRMDLLHKPAKVYLWGTGKVAAWIVEQFKNDIFKLHISGFIDNDEKKQGDIFCGYKIYSPDVLENDRDCHIIILSNFWKEISGQIEDQYSESVVRCDSFHFFIKYRLIPRYQGSEDEEIKETLNYICNGSLEVFNYPFVEKYRDIDIEIEYDHQKQLFYTLFADKRMYLSRKYKSKAKIQEYLKQIMMEQDKLSPHCYLAGTFCVDQNSVVLDAGAAEGNFSLSIIDKVKKIYLIEPDKEWVEALQYTFEAYQDKVVIINKYLSDFVSEETTTVDNIVNEKLDFIKMDIEGEEYYALQGAVKTISRNDKLRCVICTYHHEFDYMVIKNFLKDMGLKTETSKGYMWFPYDNNYFYSLPTLRRGLIRAEKGKNEN